MTFTHDVSGIISPSPIKNVNHKISGLIHKMPPPPPRRAGALTRQQVNASSSRSRSQSRWTERGKRHIVHAVSGRPQQDVRVGRDASDHLQQDDAEAEHVGALVVRQVGDALGRHPPERADRAQPARQAAGTGRRGRG